MSGLVEVRDIAARYERCREALTAAGQQHVLHWWKELDDEGRHHLLHDIESVRWDQVAPLIATHVLRAPHTPVPAQLEAAPVHRAHPATAAEQQRYREAAAAGEALIRAGKVAAFTVAGGQGTRLGLDGPKGALPVTPVRNKCLFQVFAESILARSRRHGTRLRWYIMTSQANHEATGDFLRHHGHFGLDPDDVVLFSQGMLPAFGKDGRVLLESPSRLALAPDGHGGSLKALAESGALADMQRRGIEIISYFQVDNPLVKPLDPLFIGLHATAGSQMSSKVTSKADDFEKVGNICRHGDRLLVIEYSDLPRALAQARNPDGSRKFDVGNLAIHLLDVAFVDRVVAQRFQLPYHRAEKKVAHIDESGMHVEPERPNAVKLETFVFDAMPLAQRALLLEIERAEEFSPVKNATGVDSLETATRDQIRRAARWLEVAGVRVPRGGDGEPAATIEISPLLALDTDELKSRLKKPPRLEPGASVYLGAETE